MTTAVDWNGGALPPEPPEQEEPPQEEEYVSSWRPEPLWPYLEESYRPPEPEILRRADGQPLFYPGKVHALNGESESGKSWIALEAIRQEVQEGRKAVYIDYEDSAATLVLRLRALGLAPTQIGFGVTYLAPSGWDVEAMTLGETLLGGCSLVVIDGVTEGMASMTLDPLNAADVARWARRLRGFAEAGPAVVQIDHVTKNSETRGRYAIGSVHKLNAIDGAAYAVETRHPFGRGKGGFSRLTVMKDRPGAVRGACSGTRVAEVRFESDAETGAVTVTLDAPETQGPGDAFRPTVLMGKISDLLATFNEPLSANAVEKQVPGKNDAKRLALALLVEEGWVTREETRKGHLHRLVTPFDPATSPPRPTSPQPRPGRSDSDLAPSPPLYRGEGEGEVLGGEEGADLAPGRSLDSRPLFEEGQHA